MHLEYLLVIDSRETNKLDQGLLGEFALLGRGRGSECVVWDVGPVALEGGESEGIMRLVVANEAWERYHQQGREEEVRHSRYPDLVRSVNISASLVRMMGIIASIFAWTMA
jgi:hypothetical protein